MKTALRTLAAGFVLTSALCHAGAAEPLPVTTPADQGVSSQRLERLHDFLDQRTRRGDYLGAVALIARNGRIVDWRAWGWRDLARTGQMPRDAIFRIYSMTKTVTAVAVMTLMEEGKLSLDDPVGKYLPAYAKARILPAAASTCRRPGPRPARSRSVIC